MLAKIKSLLPFLVPLILIALFSVFLQVVFVSHPDKIEAFLSSLGSYFVLGYIVIQLAAIIIPPIPGYVVAITALAILGPARGLLLIYLTTTVAECVNFLIAKKYGRGIVEKAVGRKSFKKVDQYTKDAGKETLILLKLLEDSFFDYISYGLGLTQITFKQFVLVNFGLGAVNVFIKYFIFTKAPNFASSIVIIEVMSAALTSLYVFYKYRRSKRRLVKENIGPTDEI